MKDYKIFIKGELFHQDTGDTIVEGLYDVIDDNEQYDRTPTIAKIAVNDKFYHIWIDTHSIYSIVCEGHSYPIHDLDLTLFNNIPNLSEEQKYEYLEGIHPYDMTIEEYVNGDGDEFDGLGLDGALQSAMLADASYRFISKRKLDEMFINVLNNRY